MNRRLLNGCFAFGSAIAALGLILMLPSLGHAQTIAQVKAIQGRVQRNTPPYPQLQPGESLQSGDLIYVDANARAIVQCNNGQQHQLPIGSSGINNYCGNRAPIFAGPQPRMPSRQGGDPVALRTVESLTPDRRAELDTEIAQRSGIPPDQRSLELANLYARFDLPKPAIEVLEASVSPSSAQRSSLLGSLYWQVRDDARAEQAYRQALQLARQTNDANSAQQISGAQAALLQIAASYLESQKLESAEALLKHLSQLPNSLAYQRELYFADLYWQRGALDLVDRAIDQAMIYQPDRPLAHCYRAALAAARGDAVQSRSSRLRCAATTSVPQKSVPQESVPQKSVPQESVPQKSVPQTSVPKE